ncbi:MAG: ATP-binding cassette domain-containing protein [Archangium sp.]
MSSIRAHEVGFAYDASSSLFEHVSFHLTSGWIGLVGANGAGKTTLLRLISGELQPTAGHLEREPRDARVVVCEQRVELASDELTSFAWASDGLARRLHGRLRLKADQLDRWPTLSPGERKRWQLGAALWSEPEVLLLDEPTNHLDAEGRRLLVEALQTFSGVGVVVSHDRTLLDALTRSTLRVHGGTAQAWPGSFSTARALWTNEAQQLRESQLETKRALKKEQRRLDDKRRTLESSSRQRNTGVRMKNKYDSDARTLMSGGLAEFAEKSHAANLRRTARRAEALSDELAAIVVRDDAGQRLFIDWEPCPRSVVLTLDADSLKHAPGATQLALGRDEHVWVRGRNGAGKTTLLNRARELCTLPDERVLWLPQELSLEETVQDLEAVKALPADERGRVFQLVHALGVEPDRLLATRAPSPGEGRKLRLAFGLSQQAWLTVLDEPTNHLDLPAIERLQTALAAYPGALLLVTHDEALGEAVTAKQLLLG